MRTTKFRAWDKERGEWKYKEGNDFRSYFGYPSLRNASLEWTEWTGLLDKNGSDVYEGDLITDNFGDIREVVFEDGGFWCKHPNGDKFMPTEKYREVTGNKFENPELIK